MKAIVMNSIKISPWFSLLLGILFLFTCTPYYIVPNFNSTVSEHQQVAVLPVEMIFK